METRCHASLSRGADEKIEQRSDRKAGCHAGWQEMCFYQASTCCVFYLFFYCNYLENTPAMWKGHGPAWDVDTSKGQSVQTWTCQPCNPAPIWSLPRRSRPATLSQSSSHMTEPFLSLTCWIRWISWGSFSDFVENSIFFFFFLWTKLNKNTSRSWYELTIKADTSFTHTHTYLVMQLYHWGFCSKLCTFILLNWPGGNPVGLGNIPYRLSG